MILECQNCNKKFNVKDTLIPSKALFLILETFKNQIINIFPNFENYIIYVYETLDNILILIKDLFKSY